MKNKAGTAQLTCSSRKTADEVADAAAGALDGFKNPYGSVGTPASALAVFSEAAYASCTTANEGRTAVQSTATTVTLTTCIKAGEAVLTDSMSIE